MSAKAKANFGKDFEAIMLPRVGSTFVLGAALPPLVTGGLLSSPMSHGLYRFHSTVNVNIGLVDEVALNTATAGDLLLQAGVDEYFYIPDGGVVSWFGGDVSVTLAP